MKKTPKELFNTVIKEKINSKNDTLRQLSAVYQFTITGDQGGIWRINCNENLGIEEGEGQSDCTITLSDKDFIDMIDGKLNPQMAFMMKKITVKGDISLAMKLGSILK